MCKLSKLIHSLGITLLSVIICKPWVMVLMALHESRTLPVEAATAMRSLRWFHLISKSRALLSVGVWGRDHGASEARFPFLPSHGHPKSETIFPALSGWIFPHSKCLSIRVVLKTYLPPPPPGLASKSQERRYGKVYHKFRSVEPSKDGWKLCSNNCLKPDLSALFTSLSFQQYTNLHIYSTPMTLLILECSLSSPPHLRFEKYFP